MPWCVCSEQGARRARALRLGARLEGPSLGVSSVQSDSANSRTQTSRDCKSERDALRRASVTGARVRAYSAKTVELAASDLCHAPAPKCRRSRTKRTSFGRELLIARIQLTALFSKERVVDHPLQVDGFLSQARRRKSSPDWHPWH